MARLESKIHEVIVTTLSEDGQIHAAPMGIWEEKGNFIVAPFKPSTTYNNLFRHPECVVNYTDDVRVFAGSVTGRRHWPTQVATHVYGGVLVQALAHSELRVTQLQDRDPRAHFYCRVVHEANHRPFRGFNRAQGAVIEAAVLVSRLHLLPFDKIERELKYLQIAVDKAAGPREWEAWEWLMEQVQHYRGEEIKS
ncbi:DUF447 domain-containing protein [Nitrosococcus wardiae]|uniref:DUF447 family protein n=1 Tax=Nitrosococcus wardiae TaxID=1814290 RepID=A0A4P7BX17_9GAMM|nr:DUF447 domain-containing protein [Nitrosococcus wardiae]QBQ53779.1 DUF447 family protein [Nitrosococcus wardiae]